MKASISILILAVVSLIILSGCRQIFGDGTELETIIETSQENSTILVTSPLYASIWKPGDAIEIKWIGPSVSKIDIQLFRKSNYEFTITQNLENTGSFELQIPADINISNHYLLKIINHNNPDIYQFSERFGIQN